MGRLCPIVVVALALSFGLFSRLFCCFTSSGSEEPCLLREMDGRQIWYGSYDFWLEQVSVIYVEYDEVAQGMELSYAGLIRISRTWLVVCGSSVRWKFRNRAGSPSKRFGWR